MYKRLLTTLTIALALGGAISVQAALARPADVNPHAFTQGFVRQSVPVVSEKSAAMQPSFHASVPLVTEKSAALKPTIHAPVPLVTEKSIGLNRPTESSVALVSDKLPGLHQPLSAPTTAVVASTGTEFDWGDAGIGAGATFAMTLLAVAGAVGFRRHHGQLAH